MRKCQVITRTVSKRNSVVLVCSGTVQKWWMMHAKSVADHSRHVVRRLQNCVIHILSFSFWAPLDLDVLLNKDIDAQCWQQPEHTLLSGSYTKVCGCLHIYIWVQWCSIRLITKTLWVRLTPSPLQAILRKLLTYCVLKPTQPPTLGGTRNR